MAKKNRRLQATIMLEFASLAQRRLQRFCNPSSFERVGSSPTGGSMKNCLNCNKEINDNRIYCSNQCKIEFEYKEYIKRWLSGKENGLRGKYQISMHIKRYLFEKFHFKCAKCGWGKVNPYTHNIPLEVEHIDGNYLNNSEENLTLLCPNCHSLTSTYKGANKGNGRKERRKYTK